MDGFGAEKPEIRLASSQYIGKQSVIELTLITRPQDEIRITGKSSDSRILRVLGGTERSSELVRCPATTLCEI